MLKEQKGITLVALIITIIVMLILAGVSLSLVLGEGGAINEARNVQYEQEKGKLRDAINLANTTLATDYYTDTTTEKTTYTGSTNGYDITLRTATESEKVALTKILEAIADNYQGGYTIKFLNATDKTAYTSAVPTTDASTLSDTQPTLLTYRIYIGTESGGSFAVTTDADGNDVYVDVTIDFEHEAASPYTIKGPVQLKVVE